MFGSFSNNIMMEKRELVRSRSQSDASEDEAMISPRPKMGLVHRNSWSHPGSVKNPFKSQLSNELSEEKEDTDGHNHAANMDIEGFPDPERQLSIVNSIDTECTCTYAVSRAWYKKWEEYVGAPKGSTAGKSDFPGPVDMDTHNDANNDYVNEEVWKVLLKWYGIVPTHQLDRKHLYFKDEKMFDICILSPYSGIVEHTVKKFNRFEEIGYIECQLRRIFHVPDQKKSRLWISEKAQVPRFRQLLLRFRMLNDCIHRDKMYILALEECNGRHTWPSGEPGEPKGELMKYAELTTGPVSNDHWRKQIEGSLSTLTLAVSENVRETVDSFLQSGTKLLKDREDALEQSKKTYEEKTEEVNAKEMFLDDKAKEVAKQEETLKQDCEKLQKEREEFQAREAKFYTELKRMESMHKIQETKIKLDIGGHIFTTSIQTLSRDADSMLAAMFSGRYELKKEPDGSYFIDRDGTHFRYILNFLRDGYIETGTLPSDPVLHKELLREAKYYQLVGFTQCLEELLSSNIGKLV